MGLNWNGAFEDRETFPPASQHFLLYFFNHQTEILNHRETLTLKSRSVSEYFSYLIQTWPPISGHHHTSIFPSKTTSLSKFHFVSLCFYFLGFCFSCFLKLGLFCFCDFCSANSCWTRKRWMWCTHLTKKRASRLRISSTLRCTWPTVFSLSLSLSLTSVGLHSIFNLWFLFWWIWSGVQLI